MTLTASPKYSRHYASLWVSSSYSATCLVGLWLAVEKVIHHDNVHFPIIRARSYVAGCDPDSRDDRFIKENAKEGKAGIAWRSRNETAEYQFAVAVKVL